MALMAPRSRYSALRNRTELDGSGVYILTGPPEGGAKPVRIYIGETDVLRARLDNHQKNKDFWTKVVIFTAKDLNLNKAHVRYLESRLLSIAAAANRAELDNAATTSVPTLSEADRADLESFLGDMLLIYPVLGVNAFEQVDEASQAAAATERLHLKGKDTQAEGQETSDGFVVFKGALARLDEVPSIHAYGRDLRQSLTDAGVFVAEGNRLRLTQDYVFGSPSLAAMVLLGRTSNGRVEWKNGIGVTLKELQEQALDQVASGTDLT
jgi:hypothetical protein